MIDEHISSKQNGVGTFLRELLHCMENEKRYVISFNDEVTVFQYEEKQNIGYYHIPVYRGGNFLDNAPLGIAVCSLHIADSPENVFIVNHSPCYQFLRTLKYAFPKSKIVFVIHDQGWTDTLRGNSELLKKVLTMKYIPIRRRKEFIFVRTYCKEERQMYKIVDAVVSLSNDTEQLISEVYNVPYEKNHLIPNGLIKYKGPINAPNKIRERWYLTSQDEILLFVGRTTTTKGFSILLKSFRDVLKKHSKARLVIIGNIFNMSTFVEDCGTAVSQIIYTGLIGKEELSSWYQIADLGIISSYSEQCSYTGIEMLAYGLPIVASDGWGVRNMFTEGENAHIAHIGNRKDDQSFQQSLTQAIVDVLDMNNSKILRMKQNAKRSFMENYSFNIMKEKYQQLIEQI